MTDEEALQAAIPLAAALVARMSPSGRTNNQLEDEEIKDILLQSAHAVLLAEEAMQQRWRP